MSSTTGSRIKEIRLELRLSQEEFGNIFDSGKSYISAVENDNSKLSLESLVKLLLNYKVNINYILGGVGEMFLKKNVSLTSQFEEVKDEILKEVEDLLRKKGIN